MYRVLLSHPIVNENVRHAALALAEAGMLEELWTAASWDPDKWINVLFPKWIRSELSRRSFPEKVRPVVKVHPWMEVSRLVAAKLGFQRLSARNGMLSPVAVHVNLDRRVARRIQKLPKLDAVYAYDHCALDTFQSARARGARCIYELPIGYWRVLKVISEEEVERQPDWAAVDPFKSFDDEVFLRKDAELQEADRIIVASTFTRRTLEMAPNLAGEVTVIPYGAPAVSALPIADNRASKLRVLYVGRLGLLKGLPYLLDAVRQLGKRVELTLIGRPEGTCRPLSAALAAHRWLASLPHSEILKEMSRHDVFVFPSLFDGFGLVILEAMSQGLPVIATPNTGGPDVISDGQEGFIVPIRSSTAIVEKLHILATDRARLEMMSAAARRKAAELSWDHYRRRLAATVLDVIGGK